MGVKMSVAHNLIIIMNNTNKIIGVGITALFLLITGVLVAKKDAGFGASLTQSVPAFTTASSTTFSPGHQLSLTVLQQRSRRGYASICNHSTGQVGYLIFGSTAVTGTTTSSVRLGTSACYEIDRDNLYTGAVQYIQETSTTTNSLIVMEMIK